MSTHNGFILYPTYRIKQDKSYVYLFGKLDNGKTFLTINEFEPYFFILSKDLQKAKGLALFNHQETKLRTIGKDPVTKIIFTTPKEVPGVRKLFEDNAIPCFEADIRFAYRFLIDQRLQGGVSISGTAREPREDEFVDLVFENPSLGPSAQETKLSILSFDIETSMKDNSVYAVSFFTEKVQEVLIRKSPSGITSLKNAIIYDTEEELLKQVMEKFRHIDPDIITGWNVIDFDLAVLQKRCMKYKIPFHLARLKTESKLRIAESFFEDSKADIPGRMVLDGIALMKMSFIKLDDYKLGTAAAHFLGEKKLIGQQNKGQEIDDAFEKNPQKLVDYNLKDAELVYNILKKSAVVELTILRSRLTGMQLDRVSATIASLDSLYLKELRKRNTVAPTLAFTVKENPITGGYVRASKPGIYENILVLDFKSLYPSLMRTFNIDPYSYVEDITKTEHPADLIKAPNGAMFRNDEGILPMLLEQLWHQRDDAKKRKNAQESFAVKILMNSFFGALASPNCRFFSLKMANAITHFGQHFIKMVAERIENQGIEVIYGDTDSIFVHPKTSSIKEANLIGKKIEKETNEFLKHHITEEYNRKSYLELEYEKLFIQFFLPFQRGKEEGSKKRYAGLKYKGEEDGKVKTELDFVGLEFVRRDWTELSKKFQLGILERIFHKQEVTPFIKEFVIDLQKGKYDDLLIYKKAIRKDLGEYTKTTPPHVKAARMLDKISSNIIEYVMTTDGPQPLQMKSAPIDYQHYLEKQLKPIADSVLGLYHQNFDDIISSSNQKKLFHFT